jgi:hypothetical protein
MTPSPVTAPKGVKGCAKCGRDQCRHKDKTREGFLRRKYGISLADFDSMATAQGGRCAICGTGEPGGNYGNLHVDHCHETGAVRGLLCTRCNTGIGLLRESPVALRAAAAYIEANAPRESA